MKESFIKNHFDNKSGDDLMSTITPNWGQKNIDYHLGLLNIPKDTKSVLEIGSGCGRLLKELSNKEIKGIGFDASQSMVDASKEYLKGTNVKVYKCDGEGKIQTDKLFDFVFSIITFQHIPNTDTVLQYIDSMYNHLKEGGIMTFQGLAREMNKGKLWTYHTHDDIMNKLKSLNAKNIQVKELGVWTVWRCEK